MNVNTASPEVLKALIAGALSNTPGGGSSVDGLVEEIVAKRQGQQFKSLNEAVQDANLQKALSNVAGVTSTYFRIESIGVVGIVQKRIVVVLKRGSPSVTTSTPANQMPMLYFKVE